MIADPNSGVAAKQQAYLCFLDRRGVKTLEVPIITENTRLNILRIRRYVGLISQAADHRQMRADFPSVLQVSSEICLPWVPSHQLALEPSGCLTQHHIPHGRP